MVTKFLTTLVNVCLCLCVVPLELLSGAPLMIMATAFAIDPHTR